MKGLEQIEPEGRASWKRHFTAVSLGKTALVRIDQKNQTCCTTPRTPGQDSASGRSGVYKAGAASGFGVRGLGLNPDLYMP